MLLALSLHSQAPQLRNSQMKCRVIGLSWLDGLLLVDFRASVLDASVVRIQVRQSINKIQNEFSGFFYLCGEKPLFFLCFYQHDHLRLSNVFANVF
jgi:hypothetical protein